MNIRQGSQRAVCMWDKYNMDIVQYGCFIYALETDNNSARLQFSRQP